MTAAGDNVIDESDAAARFADVVAVLARRPDVSAPDPASGSTNKFGSTALKVNGKIFAMLVRGALVVKLPRARVEELLTSCAGQPFDTGAGRIMREWVSIPVDSPAAWHELADEALAFVGPPG